MTAAILFKIVILILFAGIFISLAGGLFFLAKDKGQSRRTIYSLTTRVVLSVSLFVLLLIGYATGLIRPHGIVPAQNPATQQIQPD
jgi:cytochrome bd-type quinol oxidase subunit 2